MNGVIMHYFVLNSELLPCRSSFSSDCFSVFVTANMPHTIIVVDQLRPQPQYQPAFFVKGSFRNGYGSFSCFVLEVSSVFDRLHSYVPRKLPSVWPASGKYKKKNKKKPQKTEKKKKQLCPRTTRLTESRLISCVYLFRENMRL